MSAALNEQLERARNDLLDLTARNRLLNTPLTRGRSTRLDIVQEQGDDVFQMLVQSRQEVGFLPAPESPAPSEADQLARDSSGNHAGGLPQESAEEGSAETDSNDTDSQFHLTQPEESEELDGAQGSVAASSTTEADVPRKQKGRQLQTALDDEKLQRRLLRLFYDARSMFEEQGGNSLYLALGFLEWYESPSSDKVRYAPLLLIPVELHRRTVNARFRMRVLEEEISTNLSLQSKLKVDFGLTLPDVPELEELNPAEYFAAVEQMISNQPRWRVHPDLMTLWFFSFAKFLMFRDLDPEIWPEGKRPTDHPLVSGLLGEPVQFLPPLIDDREFLDDKLTPQSLCHVVDSDSSQAAAVEEVRAGRNLVIQGPPGTGKSQSIANIIASAVRDGKTVLFIAEKMAALEVVKSRLNAIGLGEICLELHSHKAVRRAVLDDLESTLNLGRPARAEIEQQAARLMFARDDLNTYVRQLHTPLEPCGRTPYEIIGTLCRLLSQGITALNCEIPDLSNWSGNTLREKQGMLQDINEHLLQLGSPQQHAWYGVQRTTPLLPTDQQTLGRQLETLLTGLKQIQHDAARLAQLLNLPWNVEEISFQSVQRMLHLAAQLQTLPALDRAAYAHSIWEDRRDFIDQLLNRGQELQQIRKQLQGILAPVAWQTSVAEMRVDLAGAGRSWWRWFNPRWYRALNMFRGLADAPIPRDVESQLQILDQLLLGQSCREELNGGGKFDSAGRAAFGSYWQGADSEWDLLAAIVAWDQGCQQVDMPDGYRTLISSYSGSPETESVARSIKEVFKKSWESLKSLLQTLEVDSPRAFGWKSPAETPLETLVSRLACWQESLADLGRWVVFQQRLKNLEDSGLAAIIPEIEAGQVDEHSLDRLELMYCESAMRLVLQQRERISQFDGIQQTRVVEQFRQLDQERIHLARVEVASAHFQQLPTGGDFGELGIIRGEIRKKRKHRSLRRLLADAGHAVQAIKPVFMMSPISVAQFLDPGLLAFDLLVIDEASQVRPVEALGAVMRCRQAVVVGDNRQLPPTAFFDRVIAGDDADDEDEGTAVGDVESILDLCVTRNFPQRMLRWHYRSRHHSLIAVSNREFYDNGLFVIPSPERDGTARGLKFRYIADGVFDRGRSRTNKREAEAVALAMIEHARLHPELSLGVGTFSVAQRDLILDELELQRRSHPEVEEYFSRVGEEPWFVKNLENIQGDERDTIFISVGYGRDASGFLAMNFGPLTARGGERRLNVLISRAKQACVVFSSIKADEIDLRRTASRGVEALKTFLQYAETGRMELSRPTHGEHDSEFEAQVADALQAAGWQVTPQVGIAGFFIDLAVVDPVNPARFLLGIECDGASYHSARWARDRDRLRQSVLEHHGWKIHRIWSTDWFHSREEQLRKLLELLESLRQTAVPERSQPEEQPIVFEEDSEDSTESTAAPQATTGAIPREATEREEELSQFSVPYTEANFTDPLMSREIHSLKPRQLVRIIQRVVQLEGPLHEEEIIRRVTTLWGMQRTGNRISSAVQAGLQAGLAKGTITQAEGFYAMADLQECPIRNREQVTSNTLRKPDMLPPQELDAAVIKFLSTHVSATPDETARGVARILGFRATSPQLKTRIDTRIGHLLNCGEIHRDKDVLRAGSPSG